MDTLCKRMDFQVLDTTTDIQLNKLNNLFLFSFHIISLE